MKGRWVSERRGVEVWTNRPVEEIAPGRVKIAGAWVRAGTIVWGAGVQAHFGSLGARLEYESVKVLDEDLGTISLSFIYTFL